MNARRIRIVASIAVPMLILLLPLVVYAIDRTANQGEVPRNVSVVGVDVGGLSRADAIKVVRAYESDLQSRPATFVVGESEFNLDPLNVGLSANVEAAVDTALNQRSGGLVDGFIPWVHGFTDQIHIDLAVSVDEQAVEEHLATWEQDAIENPAYEGSVEIVGSEIVYEYPRTGERIDEPAAVAIIDSVLAEPERDVTVLPSRKRCRSSPRTTSTRRLRRCAVWSREPCSFATMNATSFSPSHPRRSAAPRSSR